LALADALFDIVSQLVTDQNYGDGERLDFIEWLWPKVGNATAQMNLDAKTPHPFDIGDAAQIHALTYLDLCIPEHGPKNIDQSYNWRAGKAPLNSWFNTAIKRDSVQFHYQKPYSGLDTADNCKSHVNETLLERGYK
jgi:hypothetical protein